MLGIGVSPHISIQGCLTYWSNGIRPCYQVQFKLLIIDILTITSGTENDLHFLFKLFSVSFTTFEFYLHHLAYWKVKLQPLKLLASDYNHSNNAADTDHILFTLWAETGMANTWVDILHKCIDVMQTVWRHLVWVMMANRHSSQIHWAPITAEFAPLFLVYWASSAGRAYKMA